MIMNFLAEGTDVGGALAQSYDVILVIISYLVAALASYAGLVMSICVRNAESSWRRRVWLTSGSIAMAIGIWAMHFTGMLALTLPCGVAYNVPITVISVIPAILACALALEVLASRGGRHQRYLIGGTLVGLGIGTMHYVGMAAMRLNAIKEYDPQIFAVSLIVAVLLGISALYIHELRYVSKLLKNENARTVISAALMGLAITGMHYTAMAAVSFFPNAAPGQTVVGVDTFWLSIGVTTVSVVIAVMAIVATIIGRLFQTTARRSRIDREQIVDAIESITDGFTLFDDKGKLTMCNHVLQEMYPALATLLKPGTLYRTLVTAWANLHSEFPGGLSAEAYVANSLRNFKDGVHVGEPREERLTDGRWIYSREHSIKHGGMVSILTDITRIKELQAVYEKLAAEDTLTKLASRRLFEDRLAHAIAVAKRLSRTLSVVYIDLDHFKPINDRFGHDTGDAVLKEVALRLQKAARDSDTVARFGGDEFAILIESGIDRIGAGVLATRIIKSIALPIFVGENECHVEASIGIVIGSLKTIDMQGLMKAADEAMYEAKRAGGSIYRIHELLAAEPLLLSSIPGPALV